MNKANAALELDEEEKIVTLTFPTTPVTYIRLDAEGADQLLAGVGALRSHMKPKIPEKFDRSLPQQHPIYPAMELDQEKATGSVALTIRDPRYGWQTYLIPPAHALLLGKALIEMTEDMQPKQ